MIELKPNIVEVGGQLIDLSKVYKVGDYERGNWGYFFLSVWIMGSNEPHKLEVPLLEGEYESDGGKTFDGKTYKEPIYNPEAVPGDSNNWANPINYTCYPRLQKFKEEFTALWKQSSYIWNG